MQHYSPLQAHHQAQDPGTEHLPLKLDPGLPDRLPPGGGGRQQHIAMLTINTGAPQGCVVSPLLYSLFTNPLIKFADDTTVLGLITDDHEAAYRRSETWQCGARTTTSPSTSARQMS